MEGYTRIPREAELVAFNIDPERKASQKREMDAAIYQFLANGGTIRVLPDGASAYKNGARKMSTNVV